MNLLRLSFLLIAMISIVACNNDDDDSGDCSQSDWVGTYTGTINCDGTTEDVTVTITANGSNAVVIEYETATSSAEYDPLTPSGCEIDESFSAGGLTGTLKASINGSSFNLDEENPLEDCIISATRQ